MAIQGQGRKETIESQNDPADYAALTETVRELVNVMRDGGLSRLDVRRGDLRISLSAKGYDGTIVVDQDHVSPGRHQAPVASTPSAQDGYVITSPMIGTFYSSPAPGERPFVLPGDSVEAGQTVAIIEAMKIMNEIVSEQHGIVEEVYVTSGGAVEYGQQLMRLSVIE